MAALVVLMTGAIRAATVPASPQDLAAAVDTAIKARDVAALVALTHTAGLSEEDKQAAHAGLAGLIPETGPVAVSVDRLPDSADISQPRIYMGRKIELSAKPLGIIRVASREGRASVETTIPYVEAEGGFLLAGRRTTDLGWTGPKDRQLGVNFAGDFARDGCEVTVKFNASGVGQTHTFKLGSCVVLGQHIDEVTITNLPADFKGRLLLTDSGVEYYRSEPITGTPNFTYRRKAE
ncbi:MAG: hypothetical protein ABII82_13530 [Verrucomicrobiota bacterium]